MFSLSVLSLILNECAITYDLVPKLSNVPYKFLSSPVTREDTFLVIACDHVFVSEGNSLVKGCYFLKIVAPFYFILLILFVFFIYIIKLYAFYNYW